MVDEHWTYFKGEYKKSGNKKWQIISIFGNNITTKIVNYTHTQNQKSNSNTDPCWKAMRLKKISMKQH